MNKLYIHPANAPLPNIGWSDTGPVIGPLKSWAVDNKNGLLWLYFEDEPVGRAWVHRLGKEVVNMEGKTVVVTLRSINRKFDHLHAVQVRNAMDALAHNQRLDPSIYKLVKGKET